jgi:REP element-mobilizing transposase RayT
MRPQRKPTRGGFREGAGRKPADPNRPRLRHVTRPATEARFPVHVTKRVCRDVMRLRNFELRKVLRHAFVNGCRMDSSRDGDVREFRICQFSIQGNHIHLICEASDNETLARGIQGWSVRVARGLNGHLARVGSVFFDRYHMEVLTTPTQTRNALCYVLQNARRHGERIDPRYGGIDPCSSAWWFDGWQESSWRVGVPPPDVRTVASPGTWLLRVGWQRAKRGLISIMEVPAARRREERAARRGIGAALPAERAARRGVGPAGLGARRREQRVTCGAIGSGALTASHRDVACI